MVCCVTYSREPFRDQTFFFFGGRITGNQTQGLTCALLLRYTLRSRIFLSTYHRAQYVTEIIGFSQTTLLL
jgi:hypothetical protein